MTTDPEKNWWAYSIDPAVRADPAKSRFSGAMDVNPEQSPGLRLLDYRGYLGLDRLLDTQRPSSAIPDERAFIVTHQLMEIVFKMIVFDMAVVGTTLEDFSSRASGGDAGAIVAAAGDEDRWRPALTASARISFACREVLPAVMRYLSDPKDADETFNSIEFHRFRENLEPASGFQSAQFRLIQRALGKSNLLAVRLFPAQTYKRLYDVDACDTVRVVDTVILREDASVATPPSDSPLDRVAHLEDVANRALERFANLADGQPAAPDGIDATDIERASMLLGRIMSARRANGRRDPVPPGDAGPAPGPVDAFRADFKAAAIEENRRRASLASARAGAAALRKRAPSSALNAVLTRLVAADEALHGTGQDSFLSVHLRVTRERLRHIRAYAAREGQPEPSIGTGGGGLEYLGWSQRYLIPLFPALVAYRELGD